MSTRTTSSPMVVRSRFGVAAAVAVGGLLLGLMLGMPGCGHQGYHTNTSLAADLGQVRNLPTRGDYQRDSYRAPSQPARHSIDGPRTPYEVTGLPPADDAVISPGIVRRPAAHFPAVIAIARLGAVKDRWGNSGEMGVLPAGDFLTAAQGEEISKWPLVKATFPLGVLGTGTQAKSVDDLRVPAMELNADLLLVYTISSEIRTGGAVPLVGLVSLGHLPDRGNDAVATASAVLIDVRTGYRYAIAEAKGTGSCAGGVHSNYSAARRAVDDAERQAFDTLFEQFRPAWRDMVNRLVEGQRGR